MKKTILAILFILYIGVTCGTSAALCAKPKLFFWKKDTTAVQPASDYRKLTGRDSVEMKGLVNVVQQGEDYYIEMPVKLMHRVFLVNNKLQQVPVELNEAGVNRGINYETKCVRFDWDKDRNFVFIRQQRVTPEVDSTDVMARSVSDNYIDPIIAALKVEAMPADSSTVLFKVNDLFNGQDRCINDVFSNINLGTSAESKLSHIEGIKAFDNCVTATSELTTVVYEGYEHVNVTVVVSSTLLLLSDKPMVRRRENQRVGYFTTTALRYGDTQQEAERHNYITRWRLEPSDTAAYMRGELVEPVKPIVFWLDRTIPMQLRGYIKQGITDWNVAFEKAGFKNAVQAFDMSDSIAAQGDDMNYSVITYDASEKANAMGPSTIDPRTGEILEADVIWWYNVRSLLREWLMVQTGPYNEAARQYNLPDSLLGEAARFVACHEVGHSLGLRHNMLASAAWPTDSLRSASFMDRVGGAAASIMDYARFNYVAQPGDGVRATSPHIGPYDLMAIEWGYRWYPDEELARTELNDFLSRHTSREYRYSEAQSQRTAIDPRALSEDLGDDAILSATYGIENLKRIMPHIVDWTRTGEAGQSYDEASKLYQAVVYQWSLYLYHVLANVGGIYIDNTTIDDGAKTFTHVEKDRQKRAVQFLIDEVFTYPDWLFNTPLSDYTYLNRKTPVGVQELAPDYALKNQQCYMLWDLLDNTRLMRMAANELHNTDEPFTAVEMIEMLHNHIFGKTKSGQKLDIMERAMQKNYVDALITAAAEGEGLKLNKHLADAACPIADAPCLAFDPHYSLSCRELSSASRILDFGGSQVQRNSDCISVKRGELSRILKLLKSKRQTGDTATRMHYEDMIMRIQSALGQQVE